MDVVPLFVHYSLWSYIKGGGKLKCCITGMFCSQTFMTLSEGGCISEFDSMQL